MFRPPRPAQCHTGIIELSNRQETGAAILEDVTRYDRVSTATPPIDICHPIFAYFRAEKEDSSAAPPLEVV